MRILRLASTGLACVAALTGCDGRETGRPEREAETAVPAPVAATRDSAELVGAARHIIGFLQGAAPFDAGALADTVTLYVAPEGGGGERRVARDLLHQPASWRVGDHSFTPPVGPGELTLAAGTHFRCQPVPLASLYDGLARLPHVGARIASGADASCLQTWNLTLVFDAAVRPPVLVAAVHDQWEW